MDNSFASYDGVTPEGNPKVECWSSNNVSHPRNVFRNSNTKFKFVCCKCHHEFESRLNDIVNGHFCPYCAGQKLCNNEDCTLCLDNSFASYDGVTPEGNPKVGCWSSNNNLIPRNVFRNSTTKFKFVCCKCDHEFESTLNNIVNGNWCPCCKNKSEQILLSYLKQSFPHKILHQFKASWCKNLKTDKHLPFDFCIESLKIIIELDGDQHFRQVSNWESPERNKDRDLYKMKKAILNNFTVIRIYQPDVFNNTNDWKDNLNNVIKLHENPTQIFIGGVYDNHF